MQFIEPSIGQIDANATHIGILAGMVAKTTGPVVELGVGHYSTPVLHYMSQVGRPTLSVETNKEWCEYFANQYQNRIHEFYCTENKLVSVDFFSNEQYKDIKWDVAFVDNGPETDRAKCVQLLRDKAKYIVVHDSEPAAVAYNWGGIWDTFKHRYYWDFYGNGTIVVSDTEEIGLV